MSLMQQVSGATIRDCVIDERMGRVIFVVNKGEIGLAIGRNGATIKNIERLVGRPVEVVEWSDDPIEFIRKALDSRYILDVRLGERIDGAKIATVVVDHKYKGAVLGRQGRNAERARLLAKRYFDIANIHIVTQPFGR